MKDDSQIKSLNGSVVIDASALLAYFLNEASAQLVEQVFTKAFRGGVELYLAEFNLAEVLWRLARNELTKTTQTIYQEEVSRLPLTIIRPAQDDTLFVAYIKGAIGGLSLADCYTTALAKRLKATLVVAEDPEFERVTDLVKVIWL